MLKNYMKEGQKLPLFGVGPYIVYGMAAVNLIGVILFGYVFKIGIFDGGINQYGGEVAPRSVWG